MKILSLENTKLFIYKESAKIPQIKDNEMLIKTSFCGLCGSDLHRIFDREEKIRSLENRILGHEVVGEVWKVGKNVEKKKIGQHVAVNPLIPCNNCYYCKNKQIQHCENLSSIGKNLPGGFSEYFTINSINTYKIEPDPLPYIMADGIAVAFHAIDLVDDFKNSKNFAIVGDGSIGYSLALLLKSFNKNVILIGRDSKKSNISKKIGIQLIDKNDLHNGYYNRYDVVFEAVGGKQSETIKLSSNLCKIKGEILVLGVYSENYDIPLTLRDFFYKEQIIKGVNSYGISSKNEDEFKLAVDFIKQNKDSVRKLITHISHPKDWKKVIFRNENSEKSIKIVFDFKN